MIRVVILLFPALISLIWAFRMGTSENSQNAPRLFLSKFMFISFLILCFHFFYFGPFPQLYVYFDIPLVFLATIVYPLYHIYFRLLTIDEELSLKKLWPYLVTPLTISIVYSIAVLITPFNEYQAWLFNEAGSDKSPQLLMLEAIHNWVVIIYMVQLVACLAGNEWLLYKYGGKAIQYYSNVRDTKRRYPRMLNISAIMLSTTSFAIGFIDNSVMRSESTLLLIIWTIFAIIFFMIGYLGMKQKPMNPAFEPLKPIEIPNQSGSDPAIAYLRDMDLLAEKIIFEFEHNKLYLNSELCIMDVVKATGSNRTYISSVINQKYKQNFCAFTNGYRIGALKETIKADHQKSADQYADLCGFGSVISMKRAVFSCTGLQYSKFKNMILYSKK